MESYTTLEFMEKIEKQPLTLFKEAAGEGLELYDYAGRVVKDPEGKSVGPRHVHPMAKVLHKEGLPVKTAGGRKVAMVGDFLLANTETPAKRSYYRLLFHETMRKEVETVLNAYNGTPINMGKVTEGMDPELQKITGGFSVSDHLRDSLQRPAIQRATQMKYIPRLVVELQDIAMRQVDMPFGGEKALIIDNDEGRFPQPRFAEYEEIPRSRFGYEDISAQIYKYGIGIEASYEFIQNAQNIGFDQLAIFFSQLATYWRLHEVNEGIDTMLQIFTRPQNPKRTTPIGDENASTQAAAHLGSKLITKAGSGTGGSRVPAKYGIDQYSWRNMFKNFDGYVPFHLRLNRLLAGAHYATEFEMLDFKDTNIPQEMVSTDGVTRANPDAEIRTADGIPYGWAKQLEEQGTDGLGHYLAYDLNWALLYYVRMQSDIQETEKFILNQTQLWVISKAYGFRVFDEDAIQRIAVHMRPATTINVTPSSN